MADEDSDVEILPQAQWAKHPQELEIVSGITYEMDIEDHRANPGNNCLEAVSLEDEDEKWADDEGSLVIDEEATRPGAEAIKLDSQPKIYPAKDPVSDPLVSSSKQRKPKLFGCPYCDLKFTSQYGSKRHGDTVHLDRLIEDKCISPSDVENMDKEKRRKRVCFYCNVLLSRSDKLKDHVLRKHADILIKCEECGFVLKSELDLESHSKKTGCPLMQVGVKMTFKRPKMSSAVPENSRDTQPPAFQVESRLVPIAPHHKLTTAQTRNQVVAADPYQQGNFQNQTVLPSNTQSWQPQHMGLTPSASLLSKIITEPPKCPHCNQYPAGHAFTTCCGFCDAVFPCAGVFEQHYLVCSTQVSNCPYCSVYINKNEIGEHTSMKYCHGCKLNFPCLSFLNFHDCARPVENFNVMEADTSMSLADQFFMKIEGEQEEMEDFELQSYLEDENDGIQTGNKARKLCNICKKTFCSLKNHLASVHGIGQKRFACSFCPNKYGYGHHLKNHIAKHHANPN